MARLTETGRIHKANRDYMMAVRAVRPMMPLSEQFLRKYKIGPFRTARNANANRGRSAREIVRAAMDAAAQPPMSFARHDEIFHGGMFDPASMTCSLRDDLAATEKLDAGDGGGGEGEQRRKLNGFATRQEAAEYREAYNAIVAARKAGDAKLFAKIMERAKLIFDRVSTRAFADSVVKNMEDETPKTVYHGTESGGFTVFDCDGKGKTKETGAWFSDDGDNAFSYSGKRTSFSPTVIDEEYLKEHGLLDFGWGVVNDMGEIVDEDEGIVRSEKELLEHLDLSDSEHAVEMVRLTDFNGYECGNFKTPAEAVRHAVAHKGDFIDMSDGGEPCIYECFLMLRQPEQYDAEGQNWDEITTDWVVSNPDDDGIVEPVYFSTRIEAEEFLAEHEDEGYTEVKAGLGQSSDSLVRDVRRNGWSDGCVITNVTDSGSYGGGCWDSVTDYIVFSPSAIKMADLFTFEDDGTLVGLERRFDFTDSDIRH